MKDIMAFGFDPKLTYIFSNYEQSHLFLENILKVSKSISLNEAMKVFGFDTTKNIGMVEFPSKEIAAGISSSYSFLPKNMQCLIPFPVLLIKIHILGLQETSARHLKNVSQHRYICSCYLIFKAHIGR